MNKLIEELAEKADVWYPDAYPSGEGGDDAWKNYAIFDKEDLEKFAKLIVKECVLILSENTDNANNPEWYKAIIKLEEYFGIESMYDEDDYDVVIDVLTKHRDILWNMTERNMNSEHVGFNIMDDIRLSQIQQIDKCIKMWKQKGGE